MEATVNVKYLKEVYNKIPSNNKIQRIVIWYDVKTELMTYYKKCDHFNLITKYFSFDIVNAWLRKI